MKWYHIISIFTILFIQGTNTFISCPAGTFPSPLGNCVSCPSGFYCPLGIIYPLLCPNYHFCSGGSSFPIQCPPGWNCPPGTSFALSCQATIYTLNRPFHPCSI